jgi:hypothetical protein
MIYVTPAKEVPHRGRKFKNAAKKAAKRKINVELRAATNRSRSNDVRNNPTWHGFDEKGNYRK